MTDDDSAASGYAIEGISHQEYLDRRARLSDEGKSLWDDVKERGVVPVQFFEASNGDYRFSTICPGCGSSLGGVIAEVPVSGWDEPRWKVENGDPDHLTMTPSLGCGGWRAGTCIGHWWIRDGRLVLA